MGQLGRFDKLAGYLIGEMRDLVQTLIWMERVNGKGVLENGEEGIRFVLNHGTPNEQKVREFLDGGLKG
jgi:hypothetical protein